MVPINPKFPVPDRSHQIPSFERDEDGVIDIGCRDDVLSDGRPFRAEMWAQDQITMLTIFFSTLGLEKEDKEGICRLLEKERLVSFTEKGRHYCQASRFTDDAGQDLWSINIVVGDENETYAASCVPIYPRSPLSGSSSLHVPPPHQSDATEPTKTTPHPSEIYSPLPDHSSKAANSLAEQMALHEAIRMLAMKTRQALAAEFQGTPVITLPPSSTSSPLSEKELREVMSVAEQKGLNEAMRILVMKTREALRAESLSRPQPDGGPAEPGTGRKST